MEKNKMIFMMALCALLAFFSLSACGFGAGQAILNGMDEEEPVTGGRTNKTDYNAPKEIESDEISDFYAKFYLYWRWRGGDRDDYVTHDFEFSVKPDETGQLIASESNSGISFPADEELLEALQAVIREDKLALKNGVYDITAGLPPEYFPCELTVNYGSGEKLTFTEDNDPDAEWSEDVYDIFAGWFKDQGDESLYPDKYTAKAARFSIEYYDPKEVIDFSTTLRDINGNIPVLPEDYYDTVTEIFAKYDVALKYDFSEFNHEENRINNHDLGFYGMSGHKPDYDEEDLEGVFVDIYIEYDDGDRFNIETSKGSEIEGMKSMLDELVGYHRELGFTPGSGNGEEVAEKGPDNGAEAGEPDLDNEPDAGEKDSNNGSETGEPDSDYDPDAPEPL